MKAILAAFNQEKALVGAFSVITNLRMDLFEAPVVTRHQQLTVYTVTRCDHRQPAPAPPHAPAAAAGGGTKNTKKSAEERRSPASRYVATVDTSHGRHIIPHHIPGHMPRCYCTLLAVFAWK